MDSFQRARTVRRNRLGLGDPSEDASGHAFLRAWMRQRPRVETLVREGLTLEQPLSPRYPKP